MVPSPVAPPPTQPARGGGQAAQGGGQAIRGGGQPGRGRLRGGCHPGRGRLRGGGQISGAQPRFYTFLARLKAESSDAVIACIVPVCHRDASILFDMGSTYSYMSSYFASYLNMSCDSLSAPIYVSTLVGDSIVVDRVYLSCVVSIRGYETRVDLLLLSMMDFDVILGMD
ncbi:uncharacterized protein [Nicotiana tomentosiformis]|uniref:uncharacterized protein n=1 Tax=Nicotiana tomentosiformis TaxID=4098 RepID=UPI00388C5BDB